MFRRTWGIYKKLKTVFRGIPSLNAAVQKFGTDYIDVRNTAKKYKNAPEGKTANIHQDYPGRIKQLKMKTKFANNKAHQA